MTDPVFQLAYDNVRRSYPPETWVSLTPRQITEAIYRELRRLDAEAAAAEEARPEPKPRSKSKRKPSRRD